MLSEKQINDPNFNLCAAIANNAVKDIAKKLDMDVLDLASEAGLNNIVDKLTAMGISALRKQEKI